MVKGSGAARLRCAETLSFFTEHVMKKPQPRTKKVIASRRSCKAVGTGLSHYVLMDRKGK